MHTLHTSQERTANTHACTDMYTDMYMHVLTCEVCYGVKVSMEGNHDVSLLGAEHQTIWRTVQLKNPRSHANHMTRDTHPHNVHT